MTIFRTACCWLAVTLPLVVADVTELRQRALKGRADAQYELAERHLEGREVEMDAKRSFEWAQKAAKQGHAKAKYRVGALYFDGMGVDRDFEKGRDLMQQSLPGLEVLSQRGDPDAQNKLAILLMRGIGTKQDVAGALEWFRKSAAKGYAKSQMDLAQSHMSGRGVPQDLNEALVWIRRAAKLEYPVALYHLGMMHMKGHGMARNLTEAKVWLEHAAKHSVVKGRATEALKVLKEAQAKGELTGAEHLKQLTAKAEQGERDAQFDMGHRHLIGKGAPQDLPRSLRWLEKAAEQGHQVAQFHLGGMLLRGRGVKADANATFPWWRRASMQGFSPAQAGLGMLFANGQGVKKDDKEAYRWFTIAMRAKDPQVVRQASLMRQKLARRMGPDAIFEGGELARQFKTKPEEVGGTAALRPKAEAGDAKAQLELAQLLAEDKEPQLVEAYAWALLAERQGLEVALELRQLLAAKMQVNQILAAKKRAKDFQPKLVPASKKD